MIQKLMPSLAPYYGLCTRKSCVSQYNYNSLSIVGNIRYQTTYFSPGIIWGKTVLRISFLNLFVVVN